MNRTSSIIISFVACFFAVQCLAQDNDKKLVIDQDLIDLVNSNRAAKWTAGSNARFEGLTITDAKVLMGTFLPGHPKYLEFQGQKKSYSTLEKTKIPSSFNSVDQWPQCANLIGMVRDQSACGSCWAFSVSAAFTDRKCISTNGTTQTMYSSHDVGACCTRGSYGCEGGNPSAAWQWSKDQGIVSGANYKEPGTCKPYPFPQCAHHVNTNLYKNCSTMDFNFERCKTRCDDGKIQYKLDKVKLSSAFGFRNNQDVQRNIMEYGPVSADFHVYADFVLYKSGVYSHVSGALLGGHSVKVIGWGEENGIPYWLAVNSWNPTWGDNGNFKIARGDSECGFEDSFYAGKF